jgi:hypothetical protein
LGKAVNLSAEAMKTGLRVWEREELQSAEWAPLDERSGAGTPQCARHDDRQSQLIYLCAAARLWFIRVRVYGFMPARDFAAGGTDDAGGGAIRHGHVVAAKRAG